MKGEWEVLGVTRTDLVAARLVHRPGDRAALRSRTATASGSTTAREEQTGNVKQVWEISRLQHLTLLATAWYLTRDEAYADRVAEPAALLVAGEPLPVRRALDQRHRARHPADQPGLDPAPARRLARRGRTCSRTTAWRSSRSGGTSSTWPRSGAGARRPTTTSSPRRPGSSWPAARSRGSRRASGGGATPPRCSSASWSATPSRPASAASSPRTTSASSPSSGSWPRSRPRPAGTR